ncbi:hypothetical protein ABEB36_000302 [Hypothenemus hampei]|uniref:Uncharacterized protein n=1 Tax=Hypothenemus hampei TaxID=57062 RepID=A0ABD1FCQ7_HYPHA
MQGYPKVVKNIKVILEKSLLPSFLHTKDYTLVKSLGATLSEKNASKDDVHAHFQMVKAFFSERVAGRALLTMELNR